MGRDDEKHKNEAGILDRSEGEHNIEAETMGGSEGTDAVTDSVDHRLARHSSADNHTDGHDAATDDNNKTDASVGGTAVVERKDKKAEQKAVPRMATSTLIV
jgi:hypothetical protein